MKRILRLPVLLAFAFAVLASFSNFAQAQKMDFAFGLSTVTAPSASSVSINDTNHAPVSLTGGTYPGFSGDAIFWHNLGVGGEVYWKATRGDYGGDSTLPFRPVFFDFNAVYAPRLASHTYLELVGGIGALATRIYCQGCGNGYNTNYSSDKHFMADFGAGVKFYPKGDFFVRPEARLYLVKNNLNFSSPRITRFGVSIGYTFGR